MLKINFKIIFSIFFFFFSFSLGAYFFLMERDWVDFSVLEYYAPSKYSIILDDQGKEIARFQQDKKEPASYEKFPEVLVKAFVAAEDWNFFSHNGIYFKGMVRSLLKNIYHGRVVQGASTITQQVADLMILNYKRTLWQKIQEIFIAFKIERCFTKEQILELYVNNIYFGRGIYGVKSACKRFWNKDVEDLTIDESAVLAGIAKSAFLYSPLNAPLMSKRRRNIVLGQMRKLKFISQEEYSDSIKKEVNIKDHIPGDPVRLYIQEWIRQWAEKKWGKETLYKKGLKIKTTINLDKQKIAEKFFCEKIESMRPQISENLNGGMISIDSYTGGIKILIGGYSFYESQYNRVFQAKRQMGSTFKPFVYASALKAGYDMDSLMVDEPFELEMGDGKTWKPKNWTNSFDGEMTFLRALTLSNNIITIKLFLELGAKHVIAWAKKFGFKHQLNPYPSLAIGTAQSCVKDLAAAFNVFANYGTHVQPYLVDWVKDEWGKKIYKNEPEKRIVLDSKTNSKMVNALSYRIKRAKMIMRPKTWLKTQAIGKTGANNEAASTWFVGSTPDLTTCVYIGRDDNKPMGRNIFANKITFPIWLEFNKLLGFKRKNFYVDPELEEVAINWNTGEKADNLNSISTVTVLKKKRKYFES